MHHQAMIDLSVLDLAPILEGGTAADALRNTLSLAQHAESWGYRRYWLAEHHNMDGLACSATAVLIGHIAGGTKTIRVGSGVSRSSSSRRTVKVMARVFMGAKYRLGRLSVRFDAPSSHDRFIRSRPRAHP